MQHGDFASWLEKEWSCEGDLAAALRGLSVKLLA